MQRCKYPIKTMNITQSYTGTYSHSKNYNGSPRDYPIDDNCGTTGRSYFYAPFDCSIKRIYGVGAKGTNTIWIQSQAPVQTPSFTDYVTIMVIHPNDDTLSKLKVGQEAEHQRSLGPGDFRRKLSAGKNLLYRSGVYKGAGNEGTAVHSFRRGTGRKCRIILFLGKLPSWSHADLTGGYECAHRSGDKLPEKKAQ